MLPARNPMERKKAKNRPAQQATEEVRPATAASHLGIGLQGDDVRLNISNFVGVGITRRLIPSLIDVDEDHILPCLPESCRVLSVLLVSLTVLF